MAEKNKNNRQEKEEEEEEEPYGVLLYYKYDVVSDLHSLLSFYEDNCRSLSLLGRVRLSPHGVNVTVGGQLSSLEKHVAAVKTFSLFEGTDFKLATSHYPLDDKVARECGFTSLSIRIVKELVTFSPDSQLKSPDIANAGTHLSPVEFHSLLQSTGQLVEKESPALTDNKGLVLLDARNIYETRIGKFHAHTVETLDPRIRQYSDLASWIDDNAEQLRGKRVLMYCTGGIRCEMASAYVRSKGAGFENVFQLYGGIQRYLEQYPDGGFFKGKNFVFDHRISVGSSDTNILGSCLLCGVSFDDYSSRCRCSYCRMLVLVCDGCKVTETVYVCELCQKNGRGIEACPSTDNCKPQEIVPNIEVRVYSHSTVPSHPHGEQGAGFSRNLRILCLHGFRQNASGFKGRTASLAKKLKSIAELIYVDAPHQLPFIYQPSVTEPKSIDTSSGSLQQVPPPENCKPKFAWFIAPDSKGSCETNWKIADGPFDPLQHQEQTEGFDTSLDYLNRVFAEEGPFDGILGFSQGAAMAALICVRELRRKHEINFGFVILCSGFAQLAGVDRGTVNCPSLHIFSSISGKDRQIANQASRDLASLFSNPVIIEHDCGHIIPTRPPYIDEIKCFLQRFL
uniref:Uncharacterized protein MANES_08G110000 n=2 Tax=Rhizophora mucronata TaxID=61149 RepID=A0A2P2LGP6_RHIMU